LVQGYVAFGRVVVAVPVLGRFVILFVPLLVVEVVVDQALFGIGAEAIGRNRRERKFPCLRRMLKRLLDHHFAGVIRKTGDRSRILIAHVHELAQAQGEPRINRPQILAAAVLHR